MCGVRCDTDRIHIISLAARFRTAARSTTLADGLAKIRAARSCDQAKLEALSSAWEDTFLEASMAFETTEAYRHVHTLDHVGSLDRFPVRNLQKTWNYPAV